MAGEIHTEEFPDALAALQARTMTPGAWFFSTCDEKFTEEDLTDEGNHFAKAYFNNESGLFYEDYGTAVAGDLPSLYHAADSWENYERLAPVFAKRLHEWRSSPESGTP